MPHPRASNPASAAVQPVPRAITITMVLAVVAGLVFLQPYLGAVLLAALTAYAFNPVYLWLRRKTRREFAAISGTLVTVMLAVVLPCALVLGAMAVQVNSLVDEFSRGDINLGSARIEQLVQSSIDRINRLLERLPFGDGGAALSQDSLMDALRNVGVKLLDGLAGWLQGAGAAAFGLVPKAILTVFLLVAMLYHQSAIGRMAHRLSPFDESINRLYFGKAAAMTRAMVKGQLVIALAQGTASAISLWIGGVNYFWFFLVLLVFLSFIPLGAGVVSLPVGAVLLFTGHVWQGLFVIAFHLVVVSTIDNFLRPMLVPREARLSAALVLLGVFAGIAAFGPLGVVYGPVVMILLVTTFEMFARYNQYRKRPALPPEAA